MNLQIQCKPNKNAHDIHNRKETNLKINMEAPIIPIGKVILSKNRNNNNVVYSIIPNIKL